MADLKLIHGRQSFRYNHFGEYELESCRAVASRLMGVTALKLTWRGISDRRARYYQIIHLDYSEYGIDDYQEFDCLPGNEDFKEKRQEMSNLWNHFTGVMGGDVISIDAPCMLRLIESALPLADEGLSRSYDSEENREFRRFACLRIGFMKDVLASRGITAADCSERDAIETLMPLRLGAYETINYFIMRLTDHDYPAAAVLTSMDRESLPGIPLTEPGIQTLIKCSIDKSDRKTDPPSDGVSFPFRCRITTLVGDVYYHSTFVIWLSGGWRSRNPSVTGIKVGSVLKLSDYEAALQTGTPEYITVFDCHDSMLKGFDCTLIEPLKYAIPLQTPNGWVYTAYRQNNSHVDSPEYRLDGDVIGYALLSIGGELVLMSHELSDISTLDDALIFSVYSPYVRTKGRYRLDSSVFRTLCQASGLMFEDLIEPE